MPQPKFRCRFRSSRILRRSSSCLHSASIVSKTLFIVPTDAHYYKIIEMLKQFKIIVIALTCFGSRRNHHQGAVLCLAKTTKWVFYVRRYRRSQYYGGISACCAGVRFTVETGTVSTVNRTRLYQRAQKKHFVVLAKRKTAP